MYDRSLAFFVNVLVGQTVAMLKNLTSNQRLRLRKPSCSYWSCIKLHSSADICSLTCNASNTINAAFPK